VPFYYAPDIYVEEVSTGSKPIEGVGTSTAGFIGYVSNPDAPRQRPIDINNWQQFVRTFLGDSLESTPLSHAVYGFFRNGGRRCWIVNIGKDEAIGGGGGPTRKGIDLFDSIDEIKIVAGPGYCDVSSYTDLIAHCEKPENYRVAILDGPLDVQSISQLTKVAVAQAPAGGTTKPDKPDGNLPALRPATVESGSAVCYWPWILVRDPLMPRKENRDNLVWVPPSGHMAGIWAKTDATVGVHKAPANVSVLGAMDVRFRVTRQDQGELNPAGINCIRLFQRAGILAWGARTLASPSSEWRYLSVRRTVNFIEESIALGTRWAVFEPNDYGLWQRLKSNIRNFLMLVHRSGALMGRTPEEAFFVQCDEETNPQEVIDAGMVVVRIGLAPVKPAEFVVFRIGQWSGGTNVEKEGGANA
jgi:phage tail sheath protein FI